MRLHIRVPGQLIYQVKKLKRYSLSPGSRVQYIRQQTAKLFRLNQSLYQTIIYRPTVRCLHCTLFCMRGRRAAICSTLNCFHQSEQIYMIYHSYIACRSHKISQLGLTLLLYLNLFCLCGNRKGILLHNQQILTYIRIREN